MRHQSVCVVGECPKVVQWGQIAHFHLMQRDGYVSADHQRPHFLATTQLLTVCKASEIKVNGAHNVQEMPCSSKKQDAYSS